MRLAALIGRYRQQIEDRYGAVLLPEQRRALAAIERCRTPACGSSIAVCPNCAATYLHHHSCSHRACPQCQNHSATAWLERQRQKLLPVRYYLLTFTLPVQLRSTAYHHQTAVYEAFFQAAAQTLREVALNPRHLGAEPGITAVLHTHSRRLDYHPHLHCLIPGGGFDRKQRLWRQAPRKCLLPVAVLRILFREKLLAALRQAGLHYPPALHRRHWVVHVRAAGHGLRALQYLSRYLYRGVISERNILDDRDGQITFRYTDAQTQMPRTRTLPAADFLYLLAQHVLPKRFRRVRDYGFLHGNANSILRRIQILLRQPLPERLDTPLPPLRCPACGAAMVFVNPHWLHLTLTASRSRAPPTAAVS